jgi:hypothetical protein
MPFDLSVALPLPLMLTDTAGCAATGLLRSQQKRMRYPARKVETRLSVKVPVACDQLPTLPKIAADPLTPKSLRLTAASGDALPVNPDMVILLAFDDERSILVARVTYIVLMSEGKEEDCPIIAVTNVGCLTSNG